MTNSENLLAQFESLELSAPDFHHTDHIKVAYSMLEKYDFIDASVRYASTIRAMAESVGVPEKYNVTITLAFMSLVAERMAHSSYVDTDTFLASNSDLLDKDVLKIWYSPERINSALARSQLLLPDKGVGDSPIHK